jgi:hypothetical protein
MPPILDNKHTSSDSVFEPSALLREARRQKGIEDVEAPSVCILDPDGDLVRRLRQSGAAKPFGGWPCYHTELDTFELGRHRVGIVGRVVGASFAARRRRVIRQRVPVARESDLGGTDYPVWAAALFRGDRPRAAG